MPAAAPLAAAPPPAEPKAEEPPAVNSPSMRLAEAKVILEKGKRNEARGLLIALAQAFPDSSEAPEALLLAAGLNTDLEQSLKELQNIVEKYPNAPETREAYSRIGEFAFILGKYDISVSGFTSYRALETDAAKVRPADIKIAMGLLRGAHYEDAQREFEQLLAKYPDLSKVPQILEGLADSRFAVGRIPEASDLFDQIDRQFPNYEFAVKLLMSRGLCAEMLGNPAKAKTHYETIYQNYPKSIEAGLAAARLQDLGKPLLPDRPAEKK
ncbi:tetratricopeptide repeat protein [Candidatus Sumerlaeota bacterium]|nr:tetratricopeptide repeat protein [Candidatus Sumerlaeota bacterium]